MRGASRTALGVAVARFDEITRGLDAGSLARLSDDLFAVLHVVDTEHILRRSLSDPSRPGSAKTEVAQVLFSGKVSAEALDIVSKLVAERWSRPGEMADGLENLAVLAEIARADADGIVDELEDELFRFGRIVESGPALRTALVDQAVPAERKVELVRGLLAGKATEATQRLIAEVVAHPRGRSPERAIAALGKAVSDRRRRLVAIVRSAVALDPQEKERLARALAGIYGHDVQVKAEVDPSVLGGMSVQVGDELVDGTIAGRLDRLKRRFER
ncbi:F0F1 ATP synthase subunit delta [Sporichthya sp.]|uniref:F0F1 ATP synthase subunit delta n=1 Tax=Sporichthya sp. TaxID=65475 RepID=UPI00181C6227|nr:F0F1 ATP synthase subunit delta [Sporichthya sp.]MBA3743103.1 F0F1 ATP synthase subunit delta [Sporichthya sp.]